MPLGGQHGAQNPPKTRPKSMKNRWKMDIKNDENFECILNGFLVALGANMAPKPSQNPSPRRCPLGVPLGSWRALGGLLGPLGAQDPILSIVYRILIDFYRFVGRFFNDFWLIFDRKFCEYRIESPVTATEWSRHTECILKADALSTVHRMLATSDYLLNNLINPCNNNCKSKRYIIYST